MRVFFRRLMYLSHSILVSTFSLLLIVSGEVARAEPSVQELQKQLEQQEARIRQLESALNVHSSGSTKDASRQLSPSDKRVDGSQQAMSSDAGYNRGFYISDKDQEESFSLKMNGRMQFRYTGFSPKESLFRFDNGKTGSQAAVNDFEIERGRLEFSGHILKPQLKFYLNLDFDTDDNHDAKAHDFWFQYQFNSAFSLYAGKAFVPGSREWIDGSTTTHLVDRSMATSFFRPDRSLGIWAIGEAFDGAYYRAMISNGFKTTDLERADVDEKFTYALSVWGEPIGEYGKGRADLTWHDNLALRLGASFTYSPVDVFKIGEPIGEASAVRLSDGTKINADDALGLGVSLRSYDIFLYALDLATKYRGWSINSEFYFRSLRNLQIVGGGNMDSVDDVGVSIDMGYFIVPSFLEGVARFSYVDGDRADASEYAAGLNYYVNGSHKNKFALDVTLLEDSPISSSGPNLFVGATGLLYRLQWQIAF